MAITIARRKFVALATGASAFGAFTQLTFGQQAGQTYRLGVVSGRLRDADIFVALFDELRLFGVTEGQNLTVLPDGFGLRNEQLSAAAAAVVKAAPNVIVASGDPAARIVQGATHTIPIVANCDDMIAAGLVRSLARPGGNITGISLLATELDGKRLDILMEAVPGARRIATLSDASSNPTKIQALQDAARSRGVELANYAVSSPDGIAPAIDAAKAWGAAALNVLATLFFSVHRRIVIDRANATSLPAIYQWPDMAEDGGLIAYGPRLTTIYRQIARQVVKVLRGVSPADLPVEQPTTFELVINLKTAKAIGHEVPAGLEGGRPARPGGATAVSCTAQISRRRNRIISAHGHGTHVPVEEPYTASKADSYTATKSRRASNALSCGADFLARHHICELQPVRRRQRDHPCGPRHFRAFRVRVDLPNPRTSVNHSPAS